MSCNTHYGLTDKENKQHHLQNLKCHQTENPGRKMSQFERQMISAETQLPFPKSKVM